MGRRKARVANNMAPPAAAASTAHTEIRAPRAVFFMQVCPSAVAGKENFGKRLRVVYVQHLVRYIGGLSDYFAGLQKPSCLVFAIVRLLNCTLNTCLEF